MTSDERVNKLSFDQTQNIRNWLQTHDPADTLGSGYQASIYLYKGPSEKYIIKKAFGSMIRKKLSEASIRHEEQVYRKLSGIPGIPKCFGLLDTKYLILEYIPGGSYRTLEHELNDKDHLEKVVCYNSNIKSWFIDELNNLGFKAYKTQANFVFVLIPEKENQSASIINDYLISNGIAVRYLLSYGLDNALRITLGTKEELNQTIQALKEFIKKND